jgi:hypothetical protein
MVHEQLKRLAISETGFVFDPKSGHSYTVNVVGMEVLICFKNGMNEKDIIKFIIDNYEVSETQLKRDYDTFIMRLRQYGLYEEEKNNKDKKNR